MRSYEAIAVNPLGTEKNRIKVEMEQRGHLGFTSSTARRLALMNTIMKRK